MIKCVLFDLDGVLADATDWHYRAFNNALISVGLKPIGFKEHLKTFNGLPTVEKIKSFKYRGVIISKEIENKIRTYKQEYTIKCIEDQCEIDPTKSELIKKLKEYGYKIGVCTNAVRETLDLILSKLDLSRFHITLSNQDVENTKPNPEIYLKAMESLNVSPDETLIVEDSEKGAKAAIESKAHLLKVDNPKGVTAENVFAKIAKISYQDLQILIPMAGKGSRFARVGYTMPKPLIPILGTSMINHVIQNLWFENSNWFFVCLDDHERLYKISTELQSYTNKNTKVILQKGYKQGAACSASLAFKNLDPEKPVLLANSDQYIDLNISDFLIAGSTCDGAIMTFQSEHPKWSYAKTNSDGYVTEVKEKQVISNHATSGIYLWNRASDFINGVNEMIANNDLHNNEYYIAPSFNYSINKNRKYRIMEIKRQQMWGLGTPEDLIKFVDHFEVK